MRDLHSRTSMALGSAPLRDKNELPDWPAFIGTFEPLGGDSPGNNEQWVATHLPTIRLAHIMVNRDKATLAKLAEPERDALEAVITSLQRSRLEMMEHWFTCEAALARLSIVIGRNVLPED